MADSTAGRRRARKRDGGVGAERAWQSGRAVARGGWLQRQWSRSTGAARALVRELRGVGATSSMAGGPSGRWVSSSAPSCSGSGASGTGASTRAPRCSRAARRPHGCPGAALPTSGAGTATSRDGVSTASGGSALGAELQRGAGLGLAARLRPVGAASSDEAAPVWARGSSARDREHSERCPRPNVAGFTGGGGGLRCGGGRIPCPGNLLRGRPRSAAAAGAARPERPERMPASRERVRATRGLRLGLTPALYVSPAISLHPCGAPAPTDARCVPR